MYVDSACLLAGTSYTGHRELLHRLHVPLTGLISGILPCLPNNRLYVEIKFNASSSIQKWQLLKSYQDYYGSNSMIFFQHPVSLTDFYLCIVVIT